MIPDDTDTRGAVFNAPKKQQPVTDNTRSKAKDSSHHLSGSQLSLNNGHLVENFPSCIVEDLENDDEYDYENHSGMDSKDTDCLLGEARFQDPAEFLPGSSCSSDSASDSKDSSEPTNEESGGGAAAEVTYYRLDGEHQLKSSASTDADTHVLSDGDEFNIAFLDENVIANKKPGTEVIDAESSDEDDEIEEDIAQENEELPDVGYGQLDDDNSECDKENTPPCVIEISDPLLSVLNEVMASPTIHSEDSLTLAKANTNEVTVSKAMTASKTNERLADDNSKPAKLVKLLMPDELAKLGNASYGISIASASQAADQIGKFSKASNANNDADQNSLLSLAASNLNSSHYFEMEDLPGK